MLILVLFIQSLALAQNNDVKLESLEDVENCIIRISYLSHEEAALPLKKEILLGNSTLYNNTEGTISVYDTIEKKIKIQFPIFFDSSLEKITISHYTMDYNQLISCVNYHGSTSNELSISLYKNLGNAYNNYGIKDNGTIYLNHSGELRLLEENLSIIKNNPKNPYALYFFKNYLDGSKRYLNESNIQTFVNTFDSLSDSLKTSDKGITLKKEIMNFSNNYFASRLSKTAPDFNIKDFNNRNYSNKDFNNTAYILAFSATWCGPCKENIPLLKKLYDKYHQQGLQILYINLHDNKAEWGKMIKEYDMKWINVSELTKIRDSKITKLFNTTAIPNYILINRYGKISYDDKQMNDLSFKKLEKHIIDALKE